MAASADTTAELMELRDAEALGVADDHHRGVRYVNAHLDDRRGDQDVQHTRGKPAHDVRLFVGRETAVQHADLQGRERARGQLLVHLLHRSAACVVLGGDARCDDEGLTPLRDLFSDPLPRAIHPGRAGHLVDDGGRHVSTAAGQLGDGRHVEVAEHGHRDRPWDGCGGHDEHVWMLVGAHSESVALLHAEPVLLVDDHQAEIGEVDALVEQGVGADDDASGSRRDLVEQVPSLGRRRRPGEEDDVGSHLGSAQSRSGTQVAEQLPYGREVLLGEHLRGRQQDRLAAPVNHGEHGPQRHHGLARADLALEQPLHRPGAVQLGEDHLADGLLLLGEDEGQPGVERVEQTGGTARPGPGAMQPGIRAAVGHGHLRRERLVEDESPTTRGVLLPARRKVDRAARRLEVDDVGRVAYPLRQRVTEAGDVVDRQLGALGDRPGRQFRRLRVEPDVARLHHLTSDAHAVRTADVAVSCVHGERGVCELRSVTEPAELAGEDPPLGAAQELLPVVDHVLLAEECDVEEACAVREPYLEAQSGGIPRRLQRGDPRHDRHIVVDHAAAVVVHELRQVGGVRAAHEVTRHVPQDVVNGPDTQDLERLAGFVADQARHGLLESPEHRCLPHVRHEPSLGNLTDKSADHSRSGKNISSSGSRKVREMRNASGRLGSYLPDSSAFTVCRETSRAFARSACVRPSRALSSRSRFRISCSASAR